MSSDKKRAKTASMDDTRDTLGRFGPGNPGGGRPRVAAEVRELAREHTTKAIETLKTLMEKGAKEETRVRAAAELLDRAWGRSTTVMGAEDGGKVSVTIRTESAPSPQPVVSAPAHNQAEPASAEKH